MRYENDNGLWVEVPDKWTMGHYNLFTEAYVAYLREREEAGEESVQVWRADVAGALVLVIEGVVTTNIPGLDDPVQIDLSQADLEIVGVLRSIVALPLKEASESPFGLKKV